MGGVFSTHVGDDQGVTPVPEPSNLWLMGTGLALLAFGRRRRGVGC
ncbi:MAG: PEP-CTERM sorting domain-containing protein [Acidiferrobacteraceae bacterium]